MTEQDYRDIRNVFLAVLGVELTVLLLQAAIPFLAERVRIQRDTWFPPAVGQEGQA